MLISEVAVKSSWISNLIYNRPNKIVTWKLLNGRVYVVKNVPRRMFDKWKSAPSTGAFFHRYIKPSYVVIRL